MSPLDAVLQFFADYGYYFLFVATALENIPVIGVFLPGEVIVVAAGVLASRGDLELSVVIGVASAGALIGTNISYWIGWRGGRALIERISRRFSADGSRIADADRYFSTHGPITVFIGRYMSGVKAFIPALAGAHKMSYWRFFVFATLGIATWTVVAAVLGFYFAENWDTLITVMKTVGWIVPILVLLILGVIWYRRRRAATSQ